MEEKIPPNGRLLVAKDLKKQDKKTQHISIYCSCGAVQMSGRLGSTICLETVVFAPYL